jgi:hypothetical protein
MKALVTLTHTILVAQALMMLTHAQELIIQALAVALMGPLAQELHLVQV